MQAPAWLAGLASQVDARIAGLLDGELSRWERVDPVLHEPLAPLREVVLAGGKRLRPAFCYWACAGAGGDLSSPKLIDAAAALELQHISAIVHDDVIDDSARRHGRQTIHRELGERHAAARWRGESRRFGDGAAILAGNLASALADRLLAGVPSAALQVFAELRLEVNAGQYLDLAGTARGDVDPAGALRICEYKSAKYTVERPLHLGAALAQGDGWERLAAPLTAFGMPLGTAFQLRDDLLDAFGDPVRTGKPVGADLREGKATYLAALARERATGPDGAFFRERYGAPDLSDHDIATLQEILVATGARDATEALISGLLSKSEAAAGDLPVTTEARVALIELAAYVGGRDQ